MKWSKLQKILKAKKEQAQVVPVVSVETAPIVTSVVPEVKEQINEEVKEEVNVISQTTKSVLNKKKKDESITE